MYWIFLNYKDSLKKFSLKHFMHTILENLGKKLEIKKKQVRKSSDLKCLMDILISTFSIFPPPLNDPK